MLTSFVQVYEQKSGYRRQMYTVINSILVSYNNRTNYI